MKKNNKKSIMFDITVLSPGNIRLKTFAFSAEELSLSWGRRMHHIKRLFAKSFAKGEFSLHLKTLYYH